MSYPVELDNYTLLLFGLVFQRDSGSEIDENNININQGFKFDEEIPLFFYTCIYKTPSSDFGDLTSVKSDKTKDSSSSHSGRTTDS